MAEDFPPLFFVGAFGALRRILAKHGKQLSRLHKNGVQYLCELIFRTKKFSRNDFVNNLYIDFWDTLLYNGVKDDIDIFGS